MAENNTEINNDIEEVKKEEKKDANAGLVWLITLLPVIALFLERYAQSRLVGIVLWSIAVVMLILCCMLDLHLMKKQGEDTTGLGKFVWLAPAYMFVRERRYGHDYYKTIMLVFFCAAAIMLNGFTQGARMTNDRMIESARNSYVSTLDNFNTTSSDTINARITSALGKKATWKCVREGDNRFVTAYGTYNGKKAEITFKIVFDGYVYKSFSLGDIVIDGKKYAGKEYTAISKKIFTTSKKTDESSGSSSSENIAESSLADSSNIA